MRNRFQALKAFYLQNASGLHMTAFVAIALYASTTLLTAINASSDAMYAAAAGAEQPHVPAHVSGHVLVHFKDGTNDADKQSALRANNASVLSEIPHIGVSVVHVPEGAEEKVQAALAHNPHVDFAELDALVEPNAIPNDPYFQNAGFWLKNINAPTAWDFTSGNGATIVAILDSGIDGTHPDLAGNLVPGYNFVANNSNTGADGSCPHGTATAGTAGAIGNNAIGVTGTAWSNKIMPLIIAAGSTSCAAPWSGMASATTYAADHGARVISISYGGVGSTYYSSTEQSAINYAWSKGAVIVASAGNSSTDTVTYPAALDHVVAVGATQAAWYNNTELANFSNYGSWMDLVAPGSVYTTDLVGSIGYSSSDYTSISGTSFSAPMTAGVFGLMFAANPALTNAQAVDMIEKNADDWGTPGFDNTYAWGHLNAARAVAVAVNSTAPDTVAPTITFNPQNRFGPQMQLAANVTDNFGVKSVSIYHNGQLMLTEPGYSYYTVPYDMSAETDGTVDTFYATATDYAGNSTTSPKVSVTVDNTPPLVSFLSPLNGADVAGWVTLKATTSAASYVYWSLDNANLNLATAGSGNIYSAQWNSSSTSAGAHTLTITAADGANNKATNSVTVNVTGSGASTTTTATSTVTVDTIVPTTAITTPASGATVSGTGVTVGASASDNIGVTRVELWEDGSLMASDAVSPYGWNWDTTRDADGTHILQTKAYDAAGNTGLSSSVSVTVKNTVATSTPDTIPPAVNITSPASGAKVKGNGAVNVSVTAADNVGVASIQISIDGALKQTCASATSCSYAWSGKNISAGSHTISATASDAAGNASQATAVISK